MDATMLVIWVIAGALGMGYFAYGRSQQMAMPMICGIVLCVYPHLTDNVWILMGVSMILAILPFVWRV